MQLKPDVTTLLFQAGTDPDALGRLYVLVEAELQRIAHAQLQHERCDPLLETYVLVNEAFCRLCRVGHGSDAEPRVWADRLHFFRLAARVMRRIRIDHARRRWQMGEFDPAMADPTSDQPGGALERDDLLLALDGKLNELASRDPEAARVFELRFFGVSTCPGQAPGGKLLSEREAAKQLGLDETTRYRVRCSWARACRYLQNQLPRLGLEV